MLTSNSAIDDQRSLDALRRAAAQDPKGAAKQAAAQFEGLFMQMVVKSMRDAVPKSEGQDSGTETFTAMLDSRFAQSMAGRPGGLAQMLEQQLTRHMQNLTAPPQVPAVGQDIPALPQSPAGAPQAPAKAAFSAPSTTSLAASSASAGKTLSRLGERAQAFLRDMLPHAQAAERATGVPAHFILGQAALESGWGRSEIRNADGSGSFNLFGIKATGWKGNSTVQPTTEYVGGQAVRQKESFRSYGSYAEAFTDYARMLSGSPRYAQAVRSAGSAEAFAGAMQRAGYATDPQYASKLTRTIQAAMAVQRATGTA